ncbi:NADP-dependent 3-hydroxy acid dehydrogenase YdfG [Chitinophaga sp. CF118]|uniref:SDR family NAD(P)-dependent oxidoreductase n=1 Tax=Chitinophaga sp. CF118 TaxID=1884367 RepID=UPI0008EA7780|nr:SDR family NAD(P)-dependent oxidoreductase [Chitinophaga sp. CF118]SFF10251.1 NADP-dependent 3-hydroxy acid dehydrogenase YdfG [Chitinophaga sp. CF118]
MKNRIAIITGASSGIGKATAHRLAEKGTRMVLNGRDKDKLAETARQVNETGNGDLARIVCGDITDEKMTDVCIAESLNTWNELPDLFVASAGRGLPGTLLNSDAAQWDSLIDTNIKGLMYQLKSISKIMVEQSAGRDFVTNPLDIVVIGSSIGRNVSPFNSVYGATKFAAHGLTEALRRQLGPQSIRVTLIEPGLVGTNFQQSAGYDMQWFETYEKEVGPILQADDIAQVIAFLSHLPGNVHLDNISIRPTRQAYP